MQKLIIIAGIIGFFCFFLAMGAGYAYTWYEYENARQQPIAFNHQVHAGQLGVACTDCHTAAAVSRQATVPSVQKCASCHKSIQIRSEIMIETDKEKIWADYEQGKITAEKCNQELAKRDLELAKRGILQTVKEYVNAQKPIEWTRVHTLPEHVYFSHKPHIKKGIDCTTCHGRVEEMGIARQVAPLTMGWCVSCHTSRNAPRDCWTCHK